MKIEQEVTKAQTVAFFVPTYGVYYGDYSKSYVDKLLKEREEAKDKGVVR